MIRHGQGSRNARPKIPGVHKVIKLQKQLHNEVYHPESRCPSPMYWFVMAPYKSPPFGSCVICFHHSVLEDALRNSIFPQPGLKSRKRRDGRHAAFALLTLRHAGHGRRTGQRPAPGIHSSPGVVGLKVKVAGGLAALGEAGEEVPAEDLEITENFAFTCKIGFLLRKKIGVRNLGNNYRTLLTVSPDLNFLNI